MMTVYLILLVALVGWKGWKAWQRGQRQWRQDMTDYRTLWEYQLANGTPVSEARRPFVQRALRRAVMPLLRQWRLWLIVAVTGAIILLING